MNEEILEKLKKAVIEYDADGAVSWARKAIDERMDPIKTLNALIDGLRHIGEGYVRGDLFLPDLVGAAETLKSAVPIIEEEIKKRGERRETLGKVVIGTVHGDIHSIGKTMVSVLLEAEGFEVIDLGVDVPAEEFIETVEKHKSDILAMSALLTVSTSEQEKVIKTLVKENIRDKVKIMVGGGAINKEFADRIGADGYEATAPDAVNLTKRLVRVE